MQHNHYHRLGFTMVELLLSMVVMTMVMGGLATAMVLASRALPNGQSAFDITLKSSDATEQIAVDLYTARTIVARSPRFVEFTVPDRNSGRAQG